MHLHACGSGFLVGKLEKVGDEINYNFSQFENYGCGVGNAGLLVLVALSCALLALPLFVTDDALSLQSTGGWWTVLCTDMVDELMQNFGERNLLADFVRHRKNAQFFLIICSWASFVDIHQLQIFMCFRWFQSTLCGRKMSDEIETRTMFSTSQFRTQLNTTLACGFGLLLSSKGNGWWVTATVVVFTVQLWRWSCGCWWHRYTCQFKKYGYSAARFQSFCSVLSSFTNICCSSFASSVQPHLGREVRFISLQSANGRWRAPWTNKAEGLIA